MTTGEAGVSIYREYGSIVLLVLVSLGLVTVMMGAVQIITRLLNRIPTPPAKISTYECGEEPVGQAWFVFNNRFYLVAILFLVFDVELVLLLPVLTRFTAYIGMGHGGEVLLKVVLFVGTLALGLVYAAARGDIQWNKSIESLGREGRSIPSQQRPS